MKKAKIVKDKVGTKTILVGGQALRNVHDESVCRGRNCCIHNPSNHHMVGWDQNFRFDTRIMERICEHGIGHPDPDNPNAVGYRHGCDGCCDPNITARRKEAIEATKRKKTNEAS